MLIQTPSLGREQIKIWMNDAAEKFAPTAGAETNRLASTMVRRAADFDFKKVRQALQRASAKTALRMIKPFRRLRNTDQAAVNESLSDALSAF